MKPVDKEEVIRYVTAELKKDLAVVRRNYEQSIKDASELPGPMQSRHDTMAAEAGWLADGMAGRISELERDIYDIEHLKMPKKRDVILICSVFGLRNQATEEEDSYIILPAGGGKEVKYDGIALKVLSNKAPLSQALFGQKQGDKVKVSLPAGEVEYLVQYVI